LLSKLKYIGIEAFLHEFPELVEGKKIPVLPKPGTPLKNEIIP